MQISEKWEDRLEWMAIIGGLFGPFFSGVTDIRLTN